MYGGSLITGLVLGILIGAITGTVFLLILNTAVGVSDKDGSSILKLTAELLAIPSFWFGGPWLSGILLSRTVSQDLTDPYVISLAVIFLAMSSYPAGRWIIRLGKSIGEGGK
jgi:hypothetical protein